MDVIENDYLKVLTTPYAAAIHSIYSKKYDRVITLVLQEEKEHTTSPTYSGNMIFPFAGRIKGALFNGIQLDRNDGENSLHGGFTSRKAVFERKYQKDTEIEYGITRSAGEDCLDARREYIARYSLNGNTICIDFSMRSEKAVIADMTSHLYFNLSGEESIRNHELSIEADKVVINNTDHTAKEIIAVDNTIFDFQKPKKLKETIESPELAFSCGLNNAFILSGNSLKLSAGGIKLTGKADTTAVVVYTGGYLDNPSSYIAIEFQDIPINSKRTVTKEASRHIEFTIE